MDFITALHLALGQFYKDDIEVEAAQVIPLLATALLLQMDPLIEQCTGIMLETINLQVHITMLCKITKAWSVGQF